MSFPRGVPIDSTHVPGKKQNCGEFGTYVAAEFTNDVNRNLCHGGVYLGREYEPCPVKSECFVAMVARKKGKPLPQFNPSAPLITPPPARPAPSFEIPRLDFRLGDFGLPTMTQAPQATTSAGDTKSFQDKYLEMLEAARQQAVSPVVTPREGALPGMKTPFIAQAINHVEVAPPTFLPRPGESTWDRLLKNILQGMIAAFGWVIWSFTKSVDLFG